jgi:hypothetical protein
MLFNTIRLLLTGILLIPIWRNAHWSVAVGMTLLFVAIEMVAWGVRTQLEHLESLSRERRR